MGHFFEDFTPGRTFALGARTITADDLRAFADLSGDRSPIHVDDDAARRAGFGGLVAHGALGIAVATGLLQQADLTGGTLVALAGLEWRFVVPVRPGDRLTAGAAVTDRRPTHHPDRGIVRLRVTLHNGDGQLVQEGVLTEIVRRRGND
jgi:acyl dehydratase